MNMKSKLLTVLTLTCGLAVASTASAHPGVAGHRHAVATAKPTVVVTPAPRVRRPARAHCATYGCSGEVTRTGPYGNTVTRSGGASCADGTCTRSGSVAGPRGGTATFDRSISR